MQRKQLPRRSIRSVLIGDRAFYAMVLAIVVPIIVQNAITNFVNLLDNIMVGQVGTEQMSGVSIANQLLFVFNLCVFGGISGAGIFSAQFQGANNQEGVRHCFRYKLYVCAILIAGALAVFLLGGKGLIMRYLHDEANTGRVEVTLEHGLNYLHIMLLGMLPFALTQVYAGTLRETGETKLPMFAGIAAVFVNLAFNWLLIFGHLGFPRMGVAGAAIATVISRYVELAIVMIYTHRNAGHYPFVKGVYASLRVPGQLARDITVKGLPLLVNEGLWSMGMAVLSQCYSVRGLDVVAAMNISNTISNLFAVTFLSIFSIFTSLVTLVVMNLVAPLIPRVYRTTEEVRALATSFLRVYAFCMPLFSFCNCAYFTLRSGGKTLVTFLFDSGYTWVIAVPLAWCLVHLTALPVVTVYLLVQLADFIKCVFGFMLMKKGVWLNNMVG